MKNTKENKPAKSKDSMWKTIAIFAIAFLVVFVVVSQVAQWLTPSIDVEIGTKDDLVDEQDDENVKRMIDERLKWIQFEDSDPNAPQNQNTTGDEPTSASEKVDSDRAKLEDEAVRKYEEANKRINEAMAPQPTEQPQAAEPVRTATAPVPLATQPATYQMCKVYIGSYATIEQAIAAQNKVMESNATATPFIKNVNGQFVLQAGSFASRPKAEALVQELAQSGFEARIVQE